MLDQQCYIYNYCNMPDNLCMCDDVADSSQPPDNPTASRLHSSRQIMTINKDVDHGRPFKVPLWKSISGDCFWKKGEDGRKEGWTEICELNWETISIWVSEHCCDQ